MREICNSWASFALSPFLSGINKKLSYEHENLLQTANRKQQSDAVAPGFLGSLKASVQAAVAKHLYSPRLKTQFLAKLLSAAGVGLICHPSPGVGVMDHIADTGITLRN